METLDLLSQGFGLVLQPLNIALIIGGCALGLFIGAMPGLGSVNGVAILLPMTFLVPPAGAIIFLAAIYYGAMYGGAISSIMLGDTGCVHCCCDHFRWPAYGTQRGSRPGIDYGCRRFVYWWHDLRDPIHAVCATIGGSCTGVRDGRRICTHDACFCNLCWTRWR